MTSYIYLPRPRDAAGTYLRIISINDIYKLENYPSVQTAIQSFKQTAEDAVVISCLNGDFLSPSLFTSLDGGKTMLDVLKVVDIDYICFGNHEFDIDLNILNKRLKNCQNKLLNGNISNLPIVDAFDNPLLRYDIVKVGINQVAFAGFCTNNTDIFKPGINLTIQPVFDALKEIWSECKNKADIIIPLTHQSLTQDRELLKKCEQDYQLKGKIPVVLGGHEHEVYLEEIAGSRIVKSGQDANNIVVVDVWWSTNNQLNSAVHLLPTSHLEPEEKAQIFVKKKQEFLSKLMDVEIFNIRETMSSKRTRFQPEKVASTLCSYIKKSLSEVDIVILQGGCVRGNHDYQQGTSFTYGNLLEELPFDTEIAVIQVPGQVLQDAISLTRSTPETETSGYLHADLDTVIEDYPNLKIVKINNKPFDSQHMYKLGIYQFLLTGLDEVKPLVDYIDARGSVPSLEQCIPGKNLIVEACMKDRWRTLVNFWNLENREISSTELEAAIKKAFEFLDSNQDGYISPEELHAALIEKTGNPHNCLIDMMFQSLDINDDGLVSMDELASLAM
ncbi:MAG: metallophosphoesterase [Cyanobacteria bacterium J06621_15]